MQVKIFISYSRIDGGDFAEKVHEYLSKFDYDVFTDVDNINAGDPWSDVIENNISNCKIFVIIVTPAALRSDYIDREVLQAQKEKKD